MGKKRIYLKQHLPVHTRTHIYTHTRRNISTQDTPISTRKNPKAILFMQESVFLEDSKRKGSIFLSNFIGGTRYLIKRFLLHQLRNCHKTLNRAELSIFNIEPRKKTASKCRGHRKFFLKNGSRHRNIYRQQFLKSTL